VHMVTIEDVANAAGVSIATVSRVINNDYLVTNEKVEKVKASMNELGYVPHASRHKISKGNSKMIMVITSQIIDEMLHGVKDAAANIGYDVLLNYVIDNEDKNDIIYRFEDGFINGVILINYFYNNNQIIEINNKYPLVQCGDVIELPNSFMVSIDDERAAYELTNHMLSLGKRRIAFAKLDNSTFFSREREKGYRLALQQSGIPADPALITSCDNSYESGVEVAKYLMSLENKADAVVCVYDMVAAGCINALQSNGIRVPQDIAVAGFDNIELSEMLKPNITTISQPFYEIGTEAVRTLNAIMNGEINEGRRILLNHQMIVRSSTKG
jgi:DNA-binding LacI/PurR family transcriptional regulator